MGCKQHRACDNNKRNNFVVDALTPNADDQCKPDATDAGTNSVCRQCCDRDRDCGLSLVSANAGEGPSRDGWDEDLADHELPARGPGGKNRKSMFKNLVGDYDPNDTRYTGTLTDFIPDPNDSRYDPDDPRHQDVDYAGPPNPSNLGW